MEGTVDGKKVRGMKARSPWAHRSMTDEQAVIKAHAAVHKNERLVPLGEFEVVPDSVDSSPVHPGSTDGQERGPSHLKDVSKKDDPPVLDPNDLPEP